MKKIKTLLRYKTFTIGILMVLSIVFIAIFADKIAPFTYDKLDMSAKLKAPSLIHLFGTDHLGRDIFSRVVYGSRLALIVAIIAVFIQGVIGITLGLVAGYFGKFIEKSISFIIYLTLSLPAIIIVIALIALLGPSLASVIIAVSLVAWARMSRIVSVKAMAIKSLPYIDAAKTFGENSFNILFRYILPNISPIIIILISTALPEALVISSSVSFLGIGAQPPSPEWGSLVFDGLAYIITQPWVSLLPGLVLSYTILGFNLLGEGLRDVLDPTLRS